MAFANDAPAALARDHLLPNGSVGRAPHQLDDVILRQLELVRSSRDHLDWTPEMGREPLAVCQQPGLDLSHGEPKEDLASKAEVAASQPLRRADRFVVQISESKAGAGPRGEVGPPSHEVTLPITDKDPRGAVSCLPKQPPYNRFLEPTFDEYRQLHGKNSSWSSEFTAFGSVSLRTTPRRVSADTLRPESSGSSDASTAMVDSFLGFRMTIS